jgi:hypothetical protein
MHASEIMYASLLFHLPDQEVYFWVAMGHWCIVVVVLCPCISVVTATVVTTFPMDGGRRMSLSVIFVFVVAMSDHSTYC